MAVRRVTYRWVGIIASLVLQGLCASFTWAAPVSWINGSGGNWSTPDNWDSGKVPGPSDDASITLDGTYTVTLDASASVASLALGAASGAQTLSAANRTLTLGNASSVHANGLLSMTSSTVNGPGLLTNAGTVSLTSCTINAPVSNEGLLRLLQATNLNGSVSTLPGSTLRAEGTAFTASLTVASGFTNNGTIEMIVTSGGAAGSSLTVTSGTLVNAPGGSINVLAGTGGSRTFTAQLDNQGTFFVGTALTMNKASADHLNSGTIDVSGGNLTLLQTATSPSLTNSGALTIGAGRTLSVTGGSLIYDGGALSGGGALNLASLTMTLNAGLSNAAAELTMSACTVNGPGTLTNAAGQTLSITACTINAPVSNEGLLRLLQATNLNGSVSTLPGSTLRAEGTAFTASLTVASGFTNNGTIEMIVTSGGAAGSSLTVTSGTLVNAPGGSINVLAGTGGSRTFTAQLDNQGTFFVGTALTMNKASADHLNSGTIDVSGGNLTLLQSATSPSLTNSGALTIGADRTLSVTGGSLIYDGGALSGGGALSLTNATMTLSAALSSALATLTMSTCTVNGTGLLTNPAGQTFSLTACTVNAPLSNEGLLRAMQTTTLNGSLTTLAGSTLRVEGATFTTNLTVASGFTNNGTIEMIATSGGAVATNLTVTSGTLVNAPGGSIDVLAGTGGSRTFTAQLDNQGTFFVGTALTVNKASADHLNSGTIDVSGGNLTLSQTGASPSLTNSGEIAIGSGRTATISGGTTLNASSATLRGAGTLVVSTSAFTNAGTIEPGASPGVLTVTGNAPMTATSLLAFELGGYTPGAEFDRIAVSGSVSLAGAIDIALLNGFAPGLGDSFVVLTAGSLSGGFTCLRGTELDGGLAIVPVVGSTTLTLAVVTSTSVNSSPDALDDGATTAFDAPVVIALLENDSDADGDSVILRSLDPAGASGSAIVNADGQSITYTPLLFFLGQDTLRYTIGDCGGGSDIALVVVDVGPATGVELPEEPMPEEAASPFPLEFNARLGTAGSVGLALALPRDAYVEIEVFDIEGRRIDRLVERSLAAGLHEFPWHARQASGIYFARLVARTDAEETRRTARLLLVR